MSTTRQEIVELYNIVMNEPLSPDKIISHEAINSLELKNLIIKNNNDCWIIIDNSLRFVLQATKKR